MPECSCGWKIPALDDDDDDGYMLMAKPTFLGSGTVAETNEGVCGGVGGGVANDVPSGTFASGNVKATVVVVVAGDDVVAPRPTTTDNVDGGVDMMAAVSQWNPSVGVKICLK